MVDVIVLEAVESESIRKLLAIKILEIRSDASYFHLLERLSEGGVDYIYYDHSDNDTRSKFENARYELDKLGVKYKISQRESYEPQKYSSEDQKESLSSSLTRTIEAYNKHHTTSMPAQDEKRRAPAAEEHNGSAKQDERRLTATIDAYNSSPKQNEKRRAAATIEEYNEHHTASMPKQDEKRRLTTTIEEYNGAHTTTSMPKQDEKYHPTAATPIYNMSHTTTHIPNQNDKHHHSAGATPMHDSHHHTNITLANLPIVDDPIYAPQKKNNVLNTIIGIAVFAATVGVMFIMYEVSKAGSTKGNFLNRQNNSNFSQTQTQLNQALAEADNACIEGNIDMEKFYRTAIALNKNNLKAWFGLLNCFEITGNDKKTLEVSEEMRRLFGSYVFSILRIIEPHGTPEVFVPHDNICNITYSRNSKSNDADRELFEIAAGIFSTGGFDSAVILAKNSNNSGFTVSVGFEKFPETLEEFKQRFTVNKVKK